MDDDIVKSSNQTNQQH